MTTTTGTAPETRSFEADVARLLHMMVHSVYSDKDVFLRELISNAADACEKLRYELLSNPDLASPDTGDDGQPRITVTLDPDARQLIVEDNGIGMSEVEMAEALGTIARSGTRAFMERVTAAKDELDAASPSTRRRPSGAPGSRARRRPARRWCSGAESR